MSRLGILVFLLVAFLTPSKGWAQSNVWCDLGEGLIYLRAVSEGSGGELDLPTDFDEEVRGRSVAGDTALIFDLRYAGGDASHAQRLSEWLGERASAPLTPLRPIFFLLNADTAPALRDAAAQFASGDVAVLIGASGEEGGLDIALAIDREEERAAYMEFAKGEADISALIGGAAAAADKPRYDEAAVIAAHTTAAAAREVTQESDSREVSREAAVRPIDLALQRAIHLHRAWRIFAPQQP